MECTTDTSSASAQASSTTKTEKKSKVTNNFSNSNSNSNAAMMSDDRSILYHISEGAIYQFPNSMMVMAMKDGLDANNNFNNNKNSNANSNTNANANDNDNLNFSGVKRKLSIPSATRASSVFPFVNIVQSSSTTGNNVSDTGKNVVLQLEDTFPATVMATYPGQPVVVYLTLHVFFVHQDQDDNPPPVNTIDNDTSCCLKPANEDWFSKKSRLHFLQKNIGTWLQVKLCLNFTSRLGSFVATVPANSLSLKPTASTIDQATQSSSSSSLIKRGDQKYQVKGVNFYGGGVLFYSVSGEPYASIKPEHSWKRFSSRAYNNKVQKAHWKHQGNNIAFLINYEAKIESGGNIDLVYTFYEEYATTTALTPEKTNVTNSSNGLLSSSNNTSSTIIAYDEVYENERGSCLLGSPRFSANALFPTDRGHWSTENGKYAPDIRFFELPNPNWTWIGPWKIVPYPPPQSVPKNTGGQGENDVTGVVLGGGWMYALNWNAGNSWSKQWNVTSCVRRRLWQRPRKKIAASGGGGGGGAGSSYHGASLSSFKFGPGTNNTTNTYNNNNNSNSNIDEDEDDDDNSLDLEDEEERYIENSNGVEEDTTGEGHVLPDLALYQSIFAACSTRRYFKIGRKRVQSISQLLSRLRLMRPLDREKQELVMGFLYRVYQLLLLFNSNSKTASKSSLNTINEDNNNAGGGGGGEEKVEKDNHLALPGSLSAGAGGLGTSSSKRKTAQLQSDLEKNMVQILTYFDYQSSKTRICQLIFPLLKSDSMYIKQALEHLKFHSDRQKASANLCK